MSVPGFYPPVAPSPGTSRKPELKLLKAEFGDGYSQTLPDGLNHMRHTFSLKWEVLTQAQGDIIEEFFKNLGGYLPFYWRHPNTKTPVLVTCGEWNREDAAAGLCSMTATFRQTFNPVE